MTLASLADAPAAAEWRSLVEKTLKGQPLDTLVSATAEGLPIAPLYLPGEGPRTALALPARDAERPWDLRAATVHPDPARANADLLADLKGGAASALVRIDPTGAAGVAIGSAAGLETVLTDIILEIAPVALDAGFLGPQAADWLAGVARGSPTAKLLFHMDPLSALARAGASPGPAESHLVSAATVAARLAARHPQAGLFLASGRVVHEAGGGEAAEIAFAAASAVAYARAAVRAGLSMDEAWGGIWLGLSADADYFVTLAKMRAARAVWARLTDACGVSVPARIEARSSHRMLAAKDAWTNMLRLGAACAGAALGGADSVALGTFTDPLGLPTAFARRQSRNTQLVLMEEAHIGRVADPAAGAGYIEALTDAMARAAWARFQAIEAAGGVIAALESGLVLRQAEEAAEARAAAGEPRIVGVTAFPPEAEAPIEVEPAPAVKAAAAPDPRLPGPDTTCPPLVPVRLSQAWEPR